ncbi:threonine-phosphate decarboxylase [Kaistia sp. 32K]|uniref:threonine-phosphate decarboxylase CobD n=1 Tax=Kaistia sp. 32K TaxID=2795690 RepID=UPI0019156837|nr:threonine-phosphate decarboxylase CobD [Kaistia sp. 32K]BCP53442.1 threonine-phosphate decarboxylase [Kaistia sp. 32K]
MLDLTALPRHGGALRDASERHGVPLADWLDLSTGINPHPYPLPDLPMEGLHRLPDPAALADLIAIARETYRVPRGVALNAVAGSDLALRLLPLIAPAGDVAVVGPTYAGHAEAWGASNRRVTIVPSLAEAAERAPIVVIVNPNNPDGRRFDPAELLTVGITLASRGGMLVVDEAFGDVAPELSVIPHLSGEPVVVLRSFGKFYGLAGLRLGFVAGRADLVAPLARLLGDWPVSGPAISIGAQALADSAWQASARRRLRAGRERLDAILEDAGLEIAGGTDLFVLARTSNATALHEALARQGIWTRIFADRPGVIRFGLPADDRFDRLRAAFARI